LSSEVLVEQKQTCANWSGKKDLSLPCQSTLCSRLHLLQDFGVSDICIVISACIPYFEEIGAGLCDLRAVFFLGKFLATLAFECLKQSL
jgi:hypothetical protein